MKDWVAMVFFAIVAVAVMLPLWGRGYIITYDMVFAPNVQFNLDALHGSWGIITGYPLTALLWMLNHIVPMDIVQKFLLTAILFVAGYSVFRSFPVRSRLARVTAGFIYMINPFVYDRFMAGHWRLLLAYAITPLVLRAFYQFFTNPSVRSLLWGVGLWTAAIIANAHHAVILGILFVALGVFFVRSVRTLLRSASLLAVLAIANSWWIIPALFGSGEPGVFSLDHFYGFQSQSDFSTGLWFNLLSLQGFWFTDWKSVKDMISWWPVLVYGWLLPVFSGLAGLRNYSRNHRRLLFGVLLAAGFGLFFAAGPAPGVWHVNTWLYEHVPGLSGLREPQKLLALLALAYALLAAYGVDFLIRLKLRMFTLMVSLVGVASMTLMVLPIWWGANGQLQPAQYPPSWYAFEDILRAEPQAKAVVLPWELYTEDTFADTLVAVPAKAFYGDRVILSQRMEVIGVDDVEPSEYHAIYKAETDQNVGDLRAAMNELGAEYVLLPNTAYNNENAEWLIHSNQFEIVISDDYLYVLRLTKAISM